MKKFAFTLAEVLITLGIIGVVAAMTMPTLIQKNNNRVVETRLMKFYSAINQAVKMAEVDYGDKKIWFEDVEGATMDNEGKPIPGSSPAEKWFNKYLAPYMKIIKTETLSNGVFMVYFPDGSALKQAQRIQTRDWVFYPGNPKKCPQETSAVGKCAFYFMLSPSNTKESFKYLYNKGFEPYKASWDGTKESLYNHPEYGCSKLYRSYCTALIQYNNWKIPDDYPYKVSY